LLIPSGFNSHLLADRANIRVYASAACRKGDFSLPQGRQVMPDTRFFSKPNSRFSSRLINSGFVLLVAALGALVIAGQVAQAQTESVLYGFCSQANCADGFHPNDALIMDAEGNLYGTTYAGGAYGVGTVFELSPAGTETILHSFRKKNGKDGYTPYAGLIMDAEGNLYGTTYAGGAHGQGTVFELSSSGIETILHSFAGHETDGAHPLAGLTMDAKGNLYGTTVGGGDYKGCHGGCGTVFEVSAGGTETILHSFAKKGNDGRGPSAGLIMDASGNLYGTTDLGGAHFYGTVFELTPDGTETVLYSFCSQGGLNCTDGANPVGTLVMDTEGNLYGATALYEGTVFEFAPNSTETVLHSFLGAPDGEVPF